MDEIRHRHVATCNDCHAPHNIFAKYAVKAENGFWHSFYFTTNRYPDVIRTRTVSARITMALRITRPAFMDGIRAANAVHGEVDYDVNREATRQEMRSYVCAQCHVEYYFQGREKRLVYPCSKGLQVEQILAYYDEVGHKDWTHAATGAPALKAQHPEFEMWNQGIHARSGLR